MGGKGSGGARARSGPAPDPMALRRERDADQWVTLPASGLDAAPLWPLLGVSDRETQLWEGLWLSKPQAHMWKLLQLELEVALYVRKLSEAELPGSMAATATLVRQLGDSLGLSTSGLRTNRWRITGDEVKTTRTTRQAARRTPSARDRLKVVPAASSE